MKNILAGLDLEILSAEDAGVIEDVAEDQDTFAGNALKKARFVAEKTGEWAVADDSGICIDALAGAPGVFSARWSEGAPLAEFTLQKMTGIKDRSAQFFSCAALATPDGQSWTFEGKIAGHLLEQCRGIAHPKLPYDVIFVPQGSDKTFAEMNDEEKNSLSHRGEAFRQLREFLLNKRDK